MVKKSSVLHLRIPFSLFLLPFFLFALAQASKINLTNAILSCIIIHLIFYPATNGFNSYFDKDEKSIGGLKHPPKVDKELYKISLFLYGISFVSGLLVGFTFTLLLAIIGIASIAYSHPTVRLKKYPVLGLITVAFFQGGYTYLLSIMAIQDLEFSEIFRKEIILPATLCSFILLGSYPMTQIYQHEEDKSRGDITFSILLGIKGTFLWTAVIFIISMVGFYYFLTTTYNLYVFFLLLICLSPVLIFYFKWLFITFKDPGNADFENTMKLNKYSSSAFILFFTLLFILKNYYK